MTPDELSHGLAWQRDMCEQAASITYQEILADLVERAESAAGPSDPIIALLLEEEADPVRSAIGIRYLGAVQRIAMRAGDSPLHAIYPTLGGRSDPDGAPSIVDDFARANLDQLRVEMRQSVQTNETGRCLLLLAGVRWAAQAVGLSRVRLLDIGASAGLNLWLDRYRFEDPSPPWGPKDSALTIEGFCRSLPPDLPAVEVIERLGCDLNPLDLADPEAALVLRSFVWPEDLVRAALLRGALAEAEPVRIDRADGVSWVEDQLATTYSDVLTVVMHSTALVYFEDEEAARFEAVLAEAGQRATAEAPLARVSFEFWVDRPDSGRSSLDVTTWPGDGAPKLLGTSHPHGRDLEWLDQP